MWGNVVVLVTLRHLAAHRTSHRTSAAN